MKRRAVFTGSFDPFTKGHLDIVRRAARIFDEITVAVCVNTEKAGAGMFSPEERIKIAEASFAELYGCTDCVINAEICPSLLADFARERGIDFIIRGARGAGEFEYETMMAEVNRALAGLETVILPAAPSLSFVSSTVARDMLIYGRGDVAMTDGGMKAAEAILARRAENAPPKKTT